jgi:hypothetical protein
MELLLSPELPPYYCLEAHLTLSGADEQEGPWENVWACRHHLDAATNALADCKEVYKDCRLWRRLSRRSGATCGSAIML